MGISRVVGRTASAPVGHLLTMAVAFRVSIDTLAFSMFYTNKEKFCRAMFASKFIGETSNNNSLLQQSVLSERTAN
jgi:hypothetical protein